MVKKVRNRSAKGLHVRFIAGFVDNDSSRISVSQTLQNILRKISSNCNDVMYIRYRYVPLNPKCFQTLKINLVLQTK